MDDWFSKVGSLMIGDYPMSPEEIHSVKLLLYIWKDLFNSDPETMPVTDLVIHTIPTYSHKRPYRSKEKLYTPKEVQ